MLERDLTKKILAYLRTLPGSWWFKHHGGPYAQRGVPDVLGTIGARSISQVQFLEDGQRVVFGDLGQFWFFEVKAEGGKLTPWQEKTIQELRAAGAQGAVVRSLEEVVAALDAAGVPRPPGRATAASATWRRLTKPGSGKSRSPKRSALDALRLAERVPKRGRQGLPLLPLSEPPASSGG